MLNYVWSGLVIISIICSVFLGNTEDLSKALVDSGTSSIELIITMAGIICLWTGIMKIAVESGLTSVFAKVFSPLLRPLFPNLNKDSDAFKSISMNISANLLGLGNAATPFGLKAMEQLHTLNNKADTASNEMVIFVVMNTASLQLLPTTLASLRQSYGSSAPFEIIVPVWISSACALAAALICACTLNCVKRKER
ncbi:nucleoside recognition domain-containing protein [Ruminococcus sp.]|uniref:nucleoside recognition domain-containing protein n=1 Tax=Ruminococcus sp. TaxID=41978 RepID=UPI003F0E33DC